MYLTTNEIFFIPDLLHYPRAYTKGYHECQLCMNENPQPGQSEHRINSNKKAMTRLRMDLQVVSRSYKWHKFILAVTDVSDFMSTIPIHQSMLGEIVDGLIQHVFSKYSIPKCMIMDQDSTFMLTFIIYLFEKLGITIKTITPYNHQPLQVEHGIESLVTIFMKHFTGLEQYWPKYPLFAMYSCDTFCSSNLNGFIPYELVLGRKFKVLIVLHMYLNMKVSGTCKEY